MRQTGLANLPEDLWHFTLLDEPYPDTYFETGNRMVSVIQDFS